MLTLYIDKTINFCKWPFALLCCIGIYPIILHFLDITGHWYNQVDLMFWVGFVSYIVLYRYVFSAKMWGSWLPTFEHELTHAIFALVTLHRVTDFHASYKKGGHIQYIGGEGNWLITISPYIFPTLLFFMILFFPYLKDQDWVWGIFGVIFAFQYLSTYREIHAKQSDLQKVGFPFAAIVIPTCNILSMTLIMAWMIGGIGHVLVVIDGMFGDTIDLIHSIWKQLRVG